MSRADPDTPRQGCNPTLPTTYILKLRPAPGSDGIRMLRLALKVLLRRFGLRCVSVEREGGTTELSVTE